MSEKPLGELPPEWADLARADAEELSPPRGAKERVQRTVALTLGLGVGFLGAATGGGAHAAGRAARGGAPRGRRGCDVRNGCCGDRDRRVAPSEEGPAAGGRRGGRRGRWNRCLPRGSLGAGTDQATGRPLH